MFAYRLIPYALRCIMHTFVHKAWMRIICIYLSVLYVEIGYVRVRAYSLCPAFVTAAGTDAAGTLGAFVVISEISLCDISYIIK